jgi:hypothetical protein
MMGSVLTYRYLLSKYDQRDMLPKNKREFSAFLARNC